MIRRRYFKNQIFDLTEVDRNTLYFDPSESYTRHFEALRDIAIAAKAKDRIAFQCACGALASLSKPHMAKLGERIRGARDEALCQDCAGYEVKHPPREPDTVIGKGLAALDRLLDKIQADNYASLCGYLYSPVMLRPAQLSSLLQGAEVTRELIAKNKLDFLLAEHGLSPLPVDLGFAGRADLTLHLLSYHRLFVFSPFFETLVSLIALGTGAQRILDPETQALQQVGLQIRPDGVGRPSGQLTEAVVIERKLAELLDYCGKQDMPEIKALIETVYRADLNRAIVEAATKASGDTLVLMQESKSLPLSEVFDISLGLHLLVEKTCGFLKTEKQRFAESSGVEEGGFILAATGKEEEETLRIVSVPEAPQPEKRSA